MNVGEAKDMNIPEKKEMVNTSKVNDVNATVMAHIMNMDFINLA